jgi:outer membrane protein assembly factor BamA
MKLEANAEVRFPLHIYKNYFEGAIFADAGNIWNIQKDNSYPNAEFNFNTLADAIAIDAGFGLRLIFPFFIVRADAAVPLRDPSELPGMRYQYYKYNTVNNTIKAVNLSFGIGYPF